MTESSGPASEDVRAVAARVQRAFERVRRERMAGLPFVNGRLAGALVGLRRWRGLWLGVRITPWFMDLLLLPGDGQADGAEPALRWPRLASGDAAALSRPAGGLEFIAGQEAQAGEDVACSLFSPMFEFAEHDMARMSAEACLAALFDAGAGRPPAAAVSQRDFLRGRWSEKATIGQRDRLQARSGRDRRSARHEQ